MTCHEHRILKGQTKEYWKTDIGLTRRIDSLSQNFSFRVVNNATKIIAPTNGAQWLQWIDAGDDRVCDVCLRYSSGGRSGFYNVTWFMPDMPVHAGCRCQWMIHWMPDFIQRRLELRFRELKKWERPQVFDKYAPKKIQKIRHAEQCYVGRTEVLIINKPDPGLVDRFKKVLDKVEPLHMVGIKIIQLINRAPKQVVRRSWKGTIEGYMGVLKKEPDKCMISIYAKGVEPEGTLLHEIAHNVWRHLTTESQVAWHKWYQYRGGKILIPGRTAQLNYEEGFAEAYRLKILHPDHIASEVHEKVEETLFG